jgi:hypothetical protein
MIACMGGFCSSRETCVEYIRGLGKGDKTDKICRVVERLCGPWEDPTPVRIRSGDSTETIKE